MAKLRLAGVVRESIVDGPGIRMTVFTQGCPHHCKGCHNEQTWDFEGGYESSTERILEEAQKDPLLKGLTLSGGEPFCQAEALSVLAKEAHSLGYDIFCYTGYTFEKLVADFDTHPEYKALLTECDWLVDGPFVLEERSLMLKFRGSKNQRILNVKKSLQESKAIEADI
ncbi:MAG: anaerobic ribonucleoside-triphosphate reductase activating protein [Ruminococcaceae bacterium]|nr:anaerobic ribonucleoside-triphosphate reductase activating protein [Oscillospiraceae bacterium]